MAQDEPLVAAQAQFAGFAIPETVVTRAKKLVIVQRPDHAQPAFLGGLRDDGGELGMDVVQMHDRGPEFIQQAVEFAAHFGGVYRPHAGLEHLPGGPGSEGDLRREMPVPFGRLVERKIHGKESDLVALVLQQPLQVQRMDAVAAAGIMKLVGEENAHGFRPAVGWLFVPVAQPEAGRPGGCASREWGRIRRCLRSCACALYLVGAGECRHAGGRHRAPGRARPVPCGNCGFFSCHAAAKGDWWIRRDSCAMPSSGS